MGQRFNVFTTEPHLTKTHYAQLFNNILYGLTTAQALVTFSKPSIYPANQGETTTPARNTLKPIYSDTNPNAENTIVM